MRVFAAVCRFECEICCVFSCGDVGRLFCRVEQQISEVVVILNKVKYNGDTSLEKLEKVLADLRHRCIMLHLQQFVYLFMMLCHTFLLLTVAGIVVFVISRL